MEIATRSTWRSSSFQADFTNERPPQRLSRPMWVFPFGGRSAEQPLPADGPLLGPAPMTSAGRQRSHEVDTGARMHDITEWIRRHQIVSFFILTFAITWGLGFSYGAVLKRSQLLLAPLFFVATCGPALSGIILTTVVNSAPRKGTRKALWLSFSVAWLVSTLLMLANSRFINHTPVSPVLIGLTVVSVLPVAFVISMAYSRVPAVRSYVSSLISVRGNWGWTLLALLFMPGLIALSLAASTLTGRSTGGRFQLPATGLALCGLIALKFFYQMFFFNATGEEVGWRGFALPRLQRLMSPLLAAFVIALFWVPWHLFLWRAEGRAVSTLSFWGEYYLVHILSSVIIVWFYVRSRGSILVAGVSHASANTAFAFLPGIDLPVFLVTGVVAAFLITVADTMWKTLPPDHPAVYSPASRPTAR
jgi:membrane protease YdiL (CAAX protease family)